MGVGVGCCRLLSCRIQTFQWTVCFYLVWLLVLKVQKFACVAGLEPQRGPQRGSGISMINSLCYQPIERGEGS